MDTSSMYVDMCREAKELQLSHMTYEACDHYYKGLKNYSQNSNIQVISMEAAGKARSVDNLVTWLPRQDQLQALIGEYSHQIETIREYLIRGSFSDLLPGLADNKTQSMEQLWLTLVMKNKYHKFWNGERWIKEK
jgi:hypothetical protein